MADFMIGAFDTSTIEFGIADHSPSTYKHQAFIEDEFKIHPRLTRRITVSATSPSFRGTRRAGGTPLLPGRAIDRRAGRASRHSVPRRSAAARRGSPTRLQQLRAAARGGVGRPRRRQDRRSRRLRRLLSADQRRDDARRRRAVAWDDAASPGPVEDPFGSLGQTEPPPESPGRFGCSPIRAFPGVRCSQYPLPIRIVYTDPNLKTSYTQHFSLSVQRQLTTNIAVEGAYVGKIGNKLVGHNYPNAAPFINSPITGLPPTLQNVEQRAPVSPGIISAQSRVLGNFFRSQLSQPAAEGRAPLRADVLLLRLVRALEEPDQPAGEHDRADQQHSEPVRSRVAVGAVFPRSPPRRRGLLGLEPAATFANRSPARW